MHTHTHTSTHSKLSHTHPTHTTHSGDEMDDARVRLAAKLAAARVEKDKKARKKAAKNGGQSLEGAEAGSSGVQGQGQQDVNGAGPSTSGRVDSASAAAGNGVSEAGGKKRPAPVNGAPPAAAAASSSHAQGQQSSQHAQPGSMPPPSKKAKKPVGMPAHATPSLYASLFTSSVPEVSVCACVGCCWCG